MFFVILVGNYNFPHKLYTTSSSPSIQYAQRLVITTIQTLQSSNHISIASVDNKQQQQQQITSPVKKLKQAKSPATKRLAENVKV
jgi:hypothetical protein